MNAGRTVFSQVMDFVPMHEFRRCVDRYRGNYKSQNFSAWDQFLCMGFAQLSYRESLRDIESCLRAMGSRLYHMGFRCRIARSTIAYNNENRDWRIFADFAQVLIATARRLYADEEFGVELSETVYALDASTVDLCLAVFPWAKFRKRKAAVKLHTLLDLRGNIPSFIWITDGKVHDVNVLDQLIPEPGAFYLMDRGYLDFARLHSLGQANAYFVTRAKRNFKFRRLYSHPVDKGTGLRSDQTVVLTGPKSRGKYPDKLRRVSFRDVPNKKRLVFLTNNFQIEALVVAQLYKCRWQVELFFKWIKQHLRIKAFYGTSENAVKVQIWIAVCVYVLVAIIRKRLCISKDLYTILQILSVTLFEQQPLLQLFTEDLIKPKKTENPKQLMLCDL